MRGGVLRHLISIERQVQLGTTAHGAPNMVWQEWRGVYAGVMVKRGREHFDAPTQQRFSEEVWQFTTRFSEVDGLDATMRILHDGKYFDIKAPLPDGQRETDVIIECTLQDGEVGSGPLMAFISVFIPDGITTEVYDGFEVEARGGAAPYTFSVGSGTLPAGLALDGSTGAVSGTPTLAGSSTVTFTVTDADGTTHTTPEIDLTVT